MYIVPLNISRDPIYQSSLFFPQYLEEITRSILCNTNVPVSTSPSPKQEITDLSGINPAQSLYYQH